MLGGAQPSNNTFIFQNPIFERHISNYMEETQIEINNSINFEQFKTIVWKEGVPNFILDFLGYISGQNSEVVALFKSTQSILQQISMLEYERLNG